jgi:hypothetical protein
MALANGNLASKGKRKEMPKIAISQDWFAVNCQKMAMAITRS